MYCKHCLPDNTLSKIEMKTKTNQYINITTLLNSQLNCRFFLSLAPVGRENECENINRKNVFMPLSYLTNHSISSTTSY